MIFDTDIIVFVQRGNERAGLMVDSADERYISTQTYLELMQKARNKEDQKKSLQYLKLMDIKTLSLTPNIGHRAMIYIEQFGLSHSLGAGDAIIAATAIENGMPLISCNEKHFKAIKELDLVVFKP
jgi:hypothetical protein